MGEGPGADSAAKAPKVSCWVLFLAGEKVCPLCGCCTFFGVGMLFFMLFVMELATQGNDIFSFDQAAVKSNLDVQNHYAFLSARGQMSGCTDEEHEDRDVCERDDECEWSSGKCKNLDPCPRPAALPRESFLLYEGRPAWVGIIYEAENGGNLLGKDILGYIDKFEKSLLTDANGAEMKGRPSRWDQDWCRMAYPAGSRDVSQGKCAAVSSFLNMFSMNAAGRAITKQQVEAGFTMAGPLMCMCSDADELCSMCTESGGVKGLGSSMAVDFSQLPADVMTCVGSMQSAGGTPSGGQDNMTASMCRRSMTGMDMQALLPFLVSFCASKPSCQWAPPEGSDVCSSTAFYRATDGDGLVEGAEMEAVMSKMCDEENAKWWGMRKALLPASFDCKSADKKASFARTLFFTGGSGEGEEEGKAFERDYVQGQTGWFAREQLLERDIEKESGGTLRVMLFSATTLRAQFLNVLFVDALLSIGSLVMVWAYMWWTLESAFLATCAMFEIVFSLPVTMSIWTVIFRQKIQFFQMLTIYMILGIGADDAFILYDAWLQAPFAGAEVMSHWTSRFSWAYSRSFKAMAVTTATTCGSFLIGACSPLPQVRDFCIFAAIVVLVDWLFCETFFASALVVYERYIKSTRAKGECCGPGCCCGLCRATAQLCCKKCVGEYDKPGAPPQKRSMERFCEGPLFNLLKRFKVAFVILWILAIGGMCGSAAASLRTATKSNPIGRESLDVIRGFEVLLSEFSIFGVPTTSIAFGLSKGEPIKEWGSTHDDDVAQYDAAEAAKLTTPQGQMEVLDLCRAADLGNDGAATRCDDRTCLVKGRGLTGLCPAKADVLRSTGVYVPDDLLCQNGRYCFMEEFTRYWAHRVANGDCPSKLTSLQCATAAGCAWDARLSVCHSTTTEDEYAGLPASDFIAHLGSGAFAAYLQTRAEVLRETGREFDMLNERTLTGFRLNAAKTELAFAWVSYNATYPRENSVEEANDWYARWETFHNLHAPDVGGIHTTELYLFMVTQNEMVKAAIMGVCLSLVISFVVLMITTWNWAVALLGLVNITSITCVFLGLMPLIGWSLGENECIFLIAVVGLSVDYSVHLLHVYNNSPAETRDEKAKHALAEMGISVTNSAITTLLAALVLFGCGFYFFLQFGAFIFLVIGFSIIMSIFFLIPLLLVIGPENKRGRLPALPCLRRA